MQGLICLWYGSVASIPTGWHLCDGTYGTPDLRDKFVFGAGGGYAVGATGGTGSHRHVFTTFGHTHTPSGAPSVATGTDVASTLTTNTDAGLTAYTVHLPPYHALCYIMKL
jgi:microcystin-dependent protein